MKNGYEQDKMALVNKVIFGLKLESTSEISMQKNMLQDIKSK